jgi:hypothetical protein
LKYKLDLAGIQEFQWNRGGTEPAGEYTFFYIKKNKKHELDRYRFIFVDKRLRGLSLLVVGCHA